LAENRAAPHTREMENAVSYYRHAMKPVIETPMSDALVVRMLLALERQLAVLERAPTRRRKSLARQLKQMQAINALIRSFAWLMQRHEAILQERANHPPVRHEEMRRELKRRLDQYLADAAESA
jgi:hypothetical protein